MSNKEKLKWIEHEQEQEGEMAKKANLLVCLCV